MTRNLYIQERKKKNLRRKKKGWNDGVVRGEERREGGKEGMEKNPTRGNSEDIINFQRPTLKRRYSKVKEGLVEGYKESGV